MESTWETQHNFDQMVVNSTEVFIMKSDNYL